MEIPESEKEQLLELLNNVLADELIIDAKTRNYTWNVTGSHVYDLHVVMRDQRRLITVAMDRLAKHIRGLDGKAVGILGEGLKRTHLDTRLDPRARPLAMVEDLLQGHEKVVGYLTSILEEHKLVLRAGSVQDLLADMLEQHREMVSTLEAIRKGRLHLKKDSS